MRVRWERIIGFILIATGIYLVFKLRPLLANIFEIANEPFGYDSPIKAIMIAALCLSFVVGIKLIVTQK